MALASSPNMPVETFLPVRARKVSAPTKFSAAGVISTFTATSSRIFCKARTSSAALYAAMQPVTPRSTLSAMFSSVPSAARLVYSAAPKQAMRRWQFGHSPSPDAVRSFAIWPV